MHCDKVSVNFGDFNKNPPPSRAGRGGDVAKPTYDLNFLAE